MEIKRRDELYEIIKKEWIIDIESINDTEVLNLQSEKYITILEQLDNMYETKSIVYKEEEVSDSSEGFKSEDLLKEEIEEVENIYTLKRSLFGGHGIKKENEDNIFVPEQVIRKQGMQHGDKFKYIEDGVYKGRDGFEKLHNLPKDENIEPNNIISYDYAFVDYDENLKQHVCKKYYDNGLESSMPMCLIHDNDIKKFDLEVGDILSVARMPDKSIVRVRWKYNSDFILPTPKPKKGSYYKEKLDTEHDKYSDEFKGISIGVVGTDTFINKYIEEVENRSGSIYHTNSDVKSMVESVVNKSDIVVIPVGQTSHAKAEAAKEIAKRSDKPFITLRNNGRTYFVNQIKEYLS